MTDGGAQAGAAEGTLFVVSTPIGNMGDFSFRAVETLRAVSAVLAEDTRHTRHLLDRYEVRTSLIAYHEHNEAKSTPGLVARLLAGESFALVSDAGTPLLSDPGSRLVRAAIDAGIRIVPIPGASALLAALVGAGLDVDRFTFFGFLPRSGKERRAALNAISGLGQLAVVYEAPARLGATLAALAANGMGARRCVVAREVTKQFEEFRRGTVTELEAYYSEATVRGEIVLLIEGAAPPDVSDELVRSRVRALRLQGSSARDAAASVAHELGVSKNAAYRIATESEVGDDDR